MINTNLRGLSLALAAVMETQDTVFLFACSLLTLEGGEKHILLIIWTLVIVTIPNKFSPGYYSGVKLTHSAALLNCEVIQPRCYLIDKMSTKAQCKIHPMFLSETLCTSIVVVNSQKKKKKFILL